MSKVRGDPRVMLLYGRELPRGCQLCFQGAKAVVFITGLCDDACYYCPIGRERMNRDVTFVNEMRVESLEDLMCEIERTGAKGASITGGDPLVRFDRTVKVIESLKETFGEGFHIHLYTSGRHATLPVLKRLERAGLDEIRFHPVLEGMEKRAELAARNTSMSVGFEVPAIPGREDWILKLALYLESVGGEFLNINEMEVSETNLTALRSRGFKINPDGVTVAGSAETAIKVLKKADEMGIDLTIHYCPAIFKDAVQTRMRFLVTAKNDLQVYEEVVETGLVRWVEVSGEKKSLRQLEELVDEGVLVKWRNKFYAHPTTLRFLTETLGRSVKIEVVEGHPTRPRFIVERTAYQ